MNNMKPVCKRCLLRDIGDKERLEAVTAYIMKLPEECKADLTVYENRLSFCRDCKHLNLGTCVRTGMYVEAAAKDLRRGCPLKQWSHVP